MIIWRWRIPKSSHLLATIEKKTKAKTVLLSSKFFFHRGWPSPKTWWILVVFERHPAWHRLLLTSPASERWTTLFHYHNGDCAHTFREGGTARGRRRRGGRTKGWDKFVKQRGFSRCQRPVWLHGTTTMQCESKVSSRIRDGCNKKNKSLLPARFVTVLWMRISP